MSTRFTNQSVAEQIRLMGDILLIKGENRFRVLAFQNAAESIANQGQDINAIYAAGELQNIPNVGRSIAGDITELLETGRIAYLEQLKQEVPTGVVEMMQVPDMGPKKAARLWQELGITSVAELKAAAAAGQLRSLSGFGAKSEEKILKGIELMERRGGDARLPLGVARPAVLDLIAALRSALPEGALDLVEPAGSVRRWKETVGDLDVLATLGPNGEAAKVMAAFQGLPQVSEVVVSGATKTRVRLANGLECDLRVVEPRHWGAALQYFTGSKEHNVSVRELALKQGWSLNEYGLTGTGKTAGITEGEERFFTTEEDLYGFLGLAWPPPQMREDRGEIELAQSGKLPRLLDEKDLLGEVHGHSTWSDGTASIAEMAAAAIRRGYRYWLVSDHSTGLGVVGGLDGERLRQQALEIRNLNAGWAAAGIDFQLLHGIEVEILADGSLGLPDEVLAVLDIVVASIHSSQRQEREAITARCIAAVRNPHVDILGHPTGRLLGRRPPSDIDLEHVLRVCAETGTVVEINANPARLDLNDIYARHAVDLGCRIAISTDAHAPGDMDLLSYGVATARRAWLTPADVINTRPAPELLGLLKGR